MVVPLDVVGEAQEACAVDVHDAEVRRLRPLAHERDALAVGRQRGAFLRSRSGDVEPAQLRDGDLLRVRVLLDEEPDDQILAGCVGFADLERDDVGRPRP